MSAVQLPEEFAVWVVMSHW